jgi:hypothetical protein
MCTVTWAHGPDGYDLLCNRDEKRTRQRAHPTRRLRSAGVAFLAPIDANFGGTWIATNEFGLTFCLVNGEGPRGVRSRGRIVMDVASCGSAAEAVDKLTRMDLTGVGAFHMVVLCLDELPIEASFDGCEIQFTEARMPLVSSSFRPDAVATRRLETFRRLGESNALVDADLLLRFHGSHDPQSGPYSPCMHRDDAETVSLSHIRVSRGATEFVYKPGPPCQNPRAINARLQRRPWAG